MGRARHGQELAGQGGACRRSTGAAKRRLALIEIHREDIASLPQLLRLLRGEQRRFLLFCDDLSFDKDDTSYKSLKAALEGGIEGRPANVLFYATSNRRHLMPRDMVDNERATAINPGEAVEEKVSLSDRFGLWLGFHNCRQDEYLAMVEAYAAPLRTEDRARRLHAEAWPGRWAAVGGRAASPGSSFRILPGTWPEDLDWRRAFASSIARIDRRGVVADLEMQLRRCRHRRSSRNSRSPGPWRTVSPRRRSAGRHAHRR